MTKARPFRRFDDPWSAGAVLGAGVVLAFAPDLFLTMIARAFLAQWAIAFLALTVWSAFRKRWWTGGAALLATTLTMWPPLRSVQEMAVPSGVRAIRVAQMNVFQPNDDHDGVFAAALGSGADLISFQEVSPEWDRALRERLSARYPHHITLPGTNCYGIALFSKLPFEAGTIASLGRRPMAEVVVKTDDGPVRILAVHATSPGSYSHFRERNAQFDRLAGLVKATDTPTVLIGDLNAVSWDRSFIRLCERTRLREHRSNLQATWPSYAGLALIPLDHVLVDPALVVSHFSTFVIPGSDHRGLVADLHFRE